MVRRQTYHGRRNEDGAVDIGLTQMGTVEPYNVDSILTKWGGVCIMIRHDQPSAAWFVIAIHTIRHGSADGGTRCMEYPNLAAALRDATRLAEGMSYKYTLAGIPKGGGKAVIAIPPGTRIEDRAGLFRRFGQLIEQLGGLFTTAPDFGTSSADMDCVAEHAAAHVFGVSTSQVDLSRIARATAIGVYTAMTVACKHLYRDESLAGRRVLVQGAGHVGGALITMLHEANASILASETDLGVIDRYAAAKGIRWVAHDAVSSTECDILAPCALGDVLNSNSIQNLRCRIVAGAANNQLETVEDAERLRERGILYIPDFVLNLGGALYDLGIALMGWTGDQAEAEIIRKVKSIVGDVIRRSESQDISTYVAARQIVGERLG